MNVLASARIAVRALRVNKMRSALTMLGIVIGVGAVITMGSGSQLTITEDDAWAIQLEVTRPGRPRPSTRSTRSGTSEEHASKTAPLLLN